MNALLRRKLQPLCELPTPVYIQLTASFINRAGGASGIFLPLFLLERYGISYASIGLIISAYGAGSLLGGYIGGYLTDHLSPQRITVWTMLTMGICALLIALPVSLPLMGLLLFGKGMAESAFRPANMRLILEPCPPRQRPLAQGVFRSSLNLGFAIAGLVGAAIAGHGYHWLFALQGVASLLATGWLLWAYRHFGIHLSAKARDAANPVQAHLGQSPWQDMPYLLFMLGTLLGIAIFDQMFGTLALFIKQVSALPPQWPGYLLAMNAILVFILQLPVSARVGQWGLIRSAIAGTLLLAVSPLPLVWLDGGQAAIIAMLLFTVGEVIVSPAWTAIIMARSEGRQRGKYLGLNSSAWSSTMLFSPALGAWALGAFGGDILWLGVASVGGIALLLQWIAIRQMRGNTEHLN